MKIHELVQGSPEWQAFRLTHHGASEAAAMLGLSKKTTRSELLRIKHTGTPKEFSDWVQVNILDYGHQVEALARPLVEEIIGEDLYPVTTSNEDEGGNLSASCDGLTMLYDTAFEHKQWNEALAASVRAGILPEEHMPQCQQIMLVTGAARVIFVVSDGTPGNLVWVEVRPDPEWFDRIRAGWAQFDRDLADYVLPEAKPAIVAEPVQALPAVSVQVSGALTVAENFTVFEQALRQFLDERLIREPQTDQDFADLDLQIKALKRAEDALDAAEAQMLAQVSGVDAAKRAKDALHKLTRDNRLMAEKLLESEKKRRREEKIEAARKAFADHLAELQREIADLRLDVPAPDFAAVIKGLKTLASVQDKLDTALANGKIAADQKAADLRTKLAWVGHRMRPNTARCCPTCNNSRPSRWTTSSWRSRPASTRTSGPRPSDWRPTARASARKKPSAWSARRRTSRSARRPPPSNARLTRRKTPPSCRCTRPMRRWRTTAPTVSLATRTHRPSWEWTWQQRRRRNSSRPAPSARPTAARWVATVAAASPPQR